MRYSKIGEKASARAGNDLSFLFHIKSNEKIGLGHLYRCRALILSLQDFGQKNIAISCSNPRLAKKVIKDIHIRFRSRHDRKAKSGYHMIIADFPGLPLKEQVELKKRCRIFVGIDDRPGKHNAFDILIRPTFLRAEVDTKVIWQGRDHILLHPDFCKVRPRKKPSLKVRNLLVCFGGSDPKNLTKRILPLLLAHFTELQLTMVVGAGYQHPEKLRKLRNGNKKLRLLENVESLAEEFLRADIALVSGGTLMFEACSLGVPSIILCQNARQNDEAGIFDKSGAVLNLGIATDVADDALIVAIKELCSDRTMRQQLSANARKMISNQGSKHTARKLVQAGMAIKP